MEVTESKAQEITKQLETVFNVKQKEMKDIPSLKERKIRAEYIEVKKLSKRR